MRARTDVDPPVRHPGHRALAIRLIDETGGRAVGSGVADILHPVAPPSRVAHLGLERAPKDVVRRAIAKLNRLVVHRAGGVMLRTRRVRNADVVRALHELDRRLDQCAGDIVELQRQIDVLRAHAEGADRAQQ